MRFHPKLFVLSAINFGGSMLVFFVGNILMGSSEGDMVANMILGGIFWMAFFFAILPSCINVEVRREWYSDKYILGSILVFILNIFIPFLANYIAFKLLL